MFIKVGETCGLFLWVCGFGLDEAINVGEAEKHRNYCWGRKIKLQILAQLCTCKTCHFLLKISYP